MSALRAAIIEETDFDTLLRLADIALGNERDAIEDRKLALLRADQMLLSRSEVSIQEAALILGKVKVVA